MDGARAYTSSTTKTHNDDMLVDSGASNCLFNTKSLFTHVNKCESTLHTANTTDFKPAGIGTAKLDFVMNDGSMIDAGFGSPHFIDLTWTYESRLFDILDTGKDYIVHPERSSPSTSSANSLSQRRALLQPAPSELAEKGTIDWMVRRSAYQYYSKLNHSGGCHTDLYTDGKQALPCWQRTASATITTPSTTLLKDHDW
ncbi:hypothetical protein CYMTET_39796 [Cymbomonas tetramitiformis]|uniref:Uncharacterized protein n=1 Tax=Cymbomonas tetramitiformis TaxID=36881 RepID=A0AAE0CAF5_9CHLO|nr:hypothetical protein CYMTET_39796 [Cymbomonas tetramitiformis]